jgi:hypothetical protein
MTKRMLVALFPLLLLHAATPEVKQKKFLTKPLVIED